MHSSVYVVVCDSLCAFAVCVCVGVYLYKDVRGVLDLRVTVQTLRHTLLNPLIQVAVEAFPLKLNERSLNNRRRQVISLFKY